MTPQIFPIIADVQIFQPAKRVCGNCDYSSASQRAFIDSDGHIDVCIACDDNGVFACGSCGTTHKHEMDCSEEYAVGWLVSGGAERLTGI